jgi:hypothetical protein
MTSRCLSKRGQEWAVGETYRVKWDVAAQGVKRESVQSDRARHKTLTRNATKKYSRMLVDDETICPLEEPVPSRRSLESVVVGNVGSRADAPASQRRAALQSGALSVEQGDERGTNVTVLIVRYTSK